MTDALRTPFEQARAAEAARVDATTEFGFTERQARFLVLVMRHTGVCVPRQYATFAGIANGGRRCNAFFDKLVGRGYAHEIPCLHNRARVFHVHHKPLYFLIGESTSRNRRPVPPRLALERLMLLDAVLMMPDVEWLTTTEEKTRYRARLEVSGDAIAAAAAPVSEASATPPRLTPAFPVGLNSEGRTVLVYLATDPSTEPFRSFLQTHASLLRVAAPWTLRLAFPRPLNRAYDAYQAVVHEELESPLHAVTIGELKWYFEHRLKAARGEPMHPQTQGFLRKGTEVFGTARFTAMYHRWLKVGDAVFEGPSAPAIAEALSSGQGHVESVVLPHVYRHLSPLAADTPSHPQRVERGLRRGNTGGNTGPHAINPRPQPPREEPALSITEQLEREWQERMDIYKAQKAQGVTP
jgi:hypothetical protein